MKLKLYFLLPLCTAFVFCLVSCGTIKYATDTGFSGYFKYIDPRNYYPYSTDAVSMKNLTKLWSIPSGSESFGNYAISDLGSNRALVQTVSGYSLYLNNTNTPNPGVFKIKNDFSNVIVSSKGLIDLDFSGIKSYDWDTGKLQNEIAFPVKKLADKTERVRSWFDESIVASNNASYIRKVGGLWLYVVVNYQISAAASNSGIIQNIKNNIILNTAQVAVFDPETYTMTVSTSFNFPSLNNENIFYSLEYADVIMDDKFLVIGFGDGKESHWYSCITLDGSAIAPTENGNADFLAKKFPAIYTSHEVKNNEKQTAVNALLESQKSKNKTQVKFGTEDIAVLTWYSVLESGILAIATPDKKGAVSTLYLADFTMKSIKWKKPLNPDLAINNVTVQDGEGGFILVPDLDKNGTNGLFAVLSLADGSPKNYVMPANLSNENGKISSVDSGILNDGSCSALYDERTHEIICYRIE